MEQTNSITRAFRMMAVATVILYLLLAVGGVVTYLNAHDQRVRTQNLSISTARALCTLRADLARRAANTTEFLREHPNGIPGIPVKTLKISLAGQRSTLRALSQLQCPPP